MLDSRSPFENAPCLGDSGSRFLGVRFEFKRQVLKLVGAAFFVRDASGAVVLYADQKAFKIKEDIRVYSAADKSREVLRIAARSILDFSAAYDVFDSRNNQKIGALRRVGLRSMVRDEWQILDAQERIIGAIAEDSMALALLRRLIQFAAFILPQKYSITLGNRAVGQFAQGANPFAMRITADFSADPNALLDRRLALAAGILLCAIEGRQD